MSKLINILKPSAFAQKGFVWLVGAGPGDADLLTIKAYKALQVADVVLFDSLVDDSVLALIPQTTLKEYVGKRSGKHSMGQPEICKRLVFHALQGRNVVRLKGGDPAVFARTVEETQALSAEQIEYVIVPGITAASGASAYSGIPLTERDCAQSVTFSTASLQTPEGEPDWQGLVATSMQQTLVFYMGLGKLSLIAARLFANGMAGDYPIAVIDNACTSKQTIIKGTILTIAALVESKAILGPAIIVCGRVVNFQQQVSQWALHCSPSDVVKVRMQGRLNSIAM